MKKLLVSIMLIPAFAGHAQFLLDKGNAVDTAMYKATYRMLHKNHPGDKDFKEDIRMLQMGRRKVKDFSHIVFHYDSLRTEGNRRGADTYSNCPETPWKVEVICDVRDRSVDAKRRSPDGIGRDVWHYRDTLPSLKWRFLPDRTDTVLGYECREAETDFAGRTYRAWFTQELPLPYGPYKFGGLPGLILRLEDSERQFVWECTGFEKTSEPIMLYDYGNERRCSASDVAKAVARYFKSPISYITGASAGMKVMLVGKDGKARPAEECADRSIPYKPLELPD